MQDRDQDEIMTDMLKVCVPQSLHCGVPVEGRHWEISFWLGWTGPSVGSTASRRTPAETHNQSPVLKSTMSEENFFFFFIY